LTMKKATEVSTRVQMRWVIRRLPPACAFRQVLAIFHRSVEKVK
jgi:hypothetical protein